MGLLIKLQNGDTQLKSLKFGKDRPEGGDSNQPYIETPIPLNVNNAAFYNDFVLRGGIKAPLSAAEDVARLTKYFFDVKNPSGLLFTAKQNLLSRVGTKTEASKGPGYAGGSLNEGIYTPASTLLQAGTGFLGFHYDKQGLEPTGLFSTGQIVTYLEAIQQNQFQGTTFLPQNNRLISLTNAITTKTPVVNFSGIQSYNLNTQDALITYQGGSDSNVGVGNTRIKFSTDNFGASIKTLTNKEYLEDNWGKKPFYQEDQVKWMLPLGATLDYASVDSGSISIVNRSLLRSTGSYIINSTSSYLPKIQVFTDSNSWMIPTGSTNLYNLTVNNNAINNSNQNLIKVFNPSSQIPRTEQGSYQLKITPNKNGSGASTLKEFNQIKEFNDKNINYDTTQSISLKLTKQNYKNLETFDTGSGEIKVTNRDLSKLPSTNARTIYSSKTQSKRTGYNPKENLVDSTELINFFINIVDPTQPTTGSLIVFPAYIDSFSDSYSSDWTGQSYMGRAEKFYKYNTFSRDINLSFTVAAHNDNELSNNYAKLNRLAASLAPTYTSAGYLAGNLHQITLGNYINNLYGIITGFTYDIMEDSPWMASFTDFAGLSERDQRDVPLYIKVSGLKFTPIHNFRPESQFNRVHSYIWPGAFFDTLT
jgi:hypothetical protein